jgi:hypothetical protein
MDEIEFVERKISIFKNNGLYGVWRVTVDQRVAVAGWQWYQSKEEISAVILMRDRVLWEHY